MTDKKTTSVRNRSWTLTMDADIYEHIVKMFNFRDINNTLVF